MLARRGLNGLGAGIAALIGGLVILPIVVAFAADPEKLGSIASNSQQLDGAQTAILRGRLTNQEGAPLAGVRVRVAIPAVDMRLVDPSTPHRQVEAKSDAKGDYRLEIPGVTKPTTISLDAMKPGYRRLAGTFRDRGDARNVEVSPGAVAEAALMLEPALYVAGTVVSEHGDPIPAVKIVANAASAIASGGIERTATNRDGSFEIFNYPVVPPVGREGPRKGAVSFVHTDYVEGNIEDVYALTQKERTALRIVLGTGYKLTGTVLDVAGKPVTNALVKVIRNDGSHRKAAITGADGKFSLRGLSKGLTKFSARALDAGQKIDLPMAVNSDKIGLEIRLRAMPLPPDLRKRTVLGVELANVTPELQSAYDLRLDRGAVIIHAGKDSGRLKIGPLAEGDNFWLVGSKRIASVREFVDQILAEAAGQDAAKNADRGVRVVYSYSRVDGDGNNTQYLRLTKEDLNELQSVSNQLAREAR